MRLPLPPAWLRFAASLALLVAAAPAVAGQTTVWHVKSGSPPGGDGLSWSTAFGSLQDGLAAAQADDQVWVAVGRYLPTNILVPGDPRSAAFDLPDDVDIYGGFLGNELQLADRAGLFELTVLSGDIGVPGDPSDNAWRVVRFAGDHPGFYPNSRLDGFLITEGRGGPGNRGGGVRITSQLGANSWAVMDLANCIVTGNSSEQGGGISIDNFCRLRISRCRIADNTAEFRGGGLQCLSAWVWSYNTVWEKNQTLGDGGAIYTNSNAADSMRFVNNLFHDNEARRGGVAFVASNSLTHGVGKYVNCTAAFNSAMQGGAFLAQAQGVLKLWNCVVWGNQARIAPQISAAGPSISVQHSSVEGGFVGPGNSSDDPLFVDPAARDLHTLVGSPVRDAGANYLVTTDPLDLDGDGDTQEVLPIDLDGWRRFVDDPKALNSGYGTPPVDMGAYEG